MKKAGLVTTLALSTISLLCIGGMSASASSSLPVAPETETHISFSGHTPNPYPDSLDLIWVPTKFEFGEHDTAGNQDGLSTYSMENRLPKYTVVQDKRAASSNEGWVVNAVASEIKAETSKGEKKLTGAKIMFGGTAIKEYKPKNDSNKVIPESEGAIVDAPSSWSNVAVSDFELAADGKTTVNVMKAAGPVLNGKYASEFKSIQLSVPKGQAQEGDYSGTITWTLTAAI